MFDDTLNSSWDDRSRHGLTTLTSFGLQALAVGVLLVLPLLRPAGLPLFRQLSTPVSLGQPLGEPPTARVRTGASTVAPSNPADLTFRAPARISSEIPASDEGAPQVAGLGPGSSGDSVRGDPRGIPNLLESGTQPVLPVAAPPARVAPVRISHMSEGDLIRKVPSGVSAAGANGAHSGAGAVAGGDQQGRRHRESPSRVRPSHAGACGN